MVLAGCVAFDILSYIAVCLVYVLEVLPVVISENGSGEVQSFFVSACTLHRVIKQVRDDANRVFQRLDMHLDIFGY